MKKKLLQLLLTRRQKERHDDRLYLEATNEFDWSRVMNLADECLTATYYYKIKDIAVHLYHLEEARCGLI